MLSERLLYLMTVKLPNIRNNLLEEMNPKWDCIVSKKHVLSTNFHENRKVEQRHLAVVKEYQKHKEKSNFDLSSNNETYFLVKRRNSQIFYITDIMNFSKFAQEICFYLLIVSLYLIQSKLKIFIHSFISSRLPHPNE